MLINDSQPATVWMTIVNEVKVDTIALYGQGHAYLILTLVKVYYATDFIRKKIVMSLAS